VLSSSSEEHSDYLGDEVDFRDGPALPDSSKFTHISEEEMQVNVPVMVPSSGEVTATEGISSIPFNYLPPSSWANILTFHLNFTYMNGYRC